MRRTTTMMAALVAGLTLAVACGPWASVASVSPIPSPPALSNDLSGGVHIGGFVQDDLLFHRPQPCFSNGDSVYASLDGASGQQFTIEVHHPALGVLTVDQRYVDGPSVIYSGAGSRWHGFSGYVWILEMQDTLVRGAIDAHLRTGSVESSPVPRTDLTVVGTWACYQGVPPVTESPMPTPVPSPRPSPGGITIAGGFNAAFLYRTPPACDFIRPNELSMTLNSSTYGQLSFGIPNEHGVGAYAVDTRYADGPWASFMGPTGIFSVSSGLISITAIAGSLYSGTIDVVMTDGPSNTIHAAGRWGCYRS